MTITSTLRGDGFPNSEVFILDQAGMPVMLNTHHRIGYAAGQLLGNARHLLGGTVVNVRINDDGNFIGPVRATRCVDFLPDARDLLFNEDDGFRDSYRTDFSLTQWNALHLDRNPSETILLGLDTDDVVVAPIPSFPYLVPVRPVRTYPRGQDWNDWDDPFTAPGPEDLPDWDHP